MTNAVHVMRDFPALHSKSHIYHRIPIAISFHARFRYQRRLELVELLDSLASAGKHAEDVEADLGSWC